MRINSGYIVNNNPLCYEILDNGFYIFEGEHATIPSIHQYEPYIPYPDCSYEDNAVKMCKELYDRSTIVVEQPFTMTEEMYNKQQSDIDYLMVLSSGMF